MKHLDLTYLLENVTDDKDFIKQLLAVFLNSLDGDIGDLETAIDACDHHKIKRSAHKVKSSFRSLGMKLMTQRLQELEDMGGNEKSIQAISEKFLEFKQDLPLIIKEVNDYIGE